MHVENQDFAKSKHMIPKKMHCFVSRDALTLISKCFCKCVCIALQHCSYQQMLLQMCVCIALQHCFFLVASLAQVADLSIIEFAVVCPLFDFNRNNVEDHGRDQVSRNVRFGAAGN